MLRAHWKMALAITAKLLFIGTIITLLFFPEKLGMEPNHDLSPQAVWEAIKQIDPTTATVWFTFATCIKLCGILCGITRWRILLRAQGVHIPFWYLAKCWFWGRAIGLFMPMVPESIAPEPMRQNWCTVTLPPVITRSPTCT